MSSLRNIVQRRNHKERSQPHTRRRLGVLEKHKDYALRAKDYKEKKSTLRDLQRKASVRNPDEFHFAMVHSRTDSRGHKMSTKHGGDLSSSASKLLKVQDAGYLRMLTQKATLGIKRHDENSVINSVLADSFSGRSSKIEFAENQQELGSLLQGAGVSTELNAKDIGQLDILGKSEAKRQARLTAWKAKSKESLVSRQKDLATASAELERKRVKMNGSTTNTRSHAERYRSQARRR